MGHDERNIQPTVTLGFVRATASHGHRHGFGIRPTMPRQASCFADHTSYRQRYDGYCIVDYYHYRVDFERVVGIV